MLQFAACSDNPYRSQTYRVQPEDTLYSIAWRFGVNYRDLARWNGIGDDFRIRVGEVLLLAQPASPAPPVPIPAPEASGMTPPPATAFVWPAEPASPPHSVPGGGLLIPGSLGAPVRATRAGRVVYSGNAIRGYGNLIIVKHDEQYLSSYAHNRDIVVHEGDAVAAGQIIAHMGEKAPHQPLLYFEIRKSGRPIDPSVFLPTK